MSVARLKDHLVKTVLPNWLAVAYDSSVGQFVEGLELDGSPEKSGVVRVRSVARQIYVYAHAAALGIAPQGAIEKAETAFASMRRKAWIPGTKPGFASSFNMRTGEIVDPRRELYDHACVLLALAWLSKVTGSSRYGDHILETSAAVDITLRSPFGGWAEDEAACLPRRQNPHMHYFEACLALWETGHGHQHSARAGELFSLFKSRFWDEELGILREFFGPSWEISGAFQSGRLDPGHMSEWAWLVTIYERLTGVDLSHFATGLLQAALELGRSRSKPFLVDEVSFDGSPLVNRRRLWPQAELLKALVVRGDTAGSADYLAAADEFASQITATYLTGAPHGTWRDAFDLEGNFIATQIPGSSLYHLWTLIPEILRAETLRKQTQAN